MAKKPTATTTLAQKDEGPSSREQEHTGPERQISFIRADNYGTVYANHARVTITPWDFMVKFGVIEDASREKLTLLEQVGVYMSAQHTKSFAKLLLSQIRKYEQEWGEIPEPKVQERTGGGTTPSAT